MNFTFGHVVNLLMHHCSVMTGQIFCLEEHFYINNINLKFNSIKRVNGFVSLDSYGVRKAFVWEC